MLAQDNNKVLQLCRLNFASSAGPSLAPTGSHRADSPCHPPSENTVCHQSSSLCCTGLSALGLESCIFSPVVHIWLPLDMAVHDRCSLCCMAA